MRPSPHENPMLDARNYRESKLKYQESRIKNPEV